MLTNLKFELQLGTSKMTNFFSQGPAMALRNDVEQGAQNLKDKLQIELHADMRHGTVRYGGQIFNVKVFYF